MSRSRVASGTVGFAAALLLSACTSTGMTSRQADELIAEVRGLRRDVAALSDSLKAVPAARAAAAAAAAAPQGPLSVSIEGAHGLGDPQSLVVLVEFTDFQCPYCRRHHVNTWPEIRKAYVETGKVRYVLKDLPLPMHPHATGAAEAARCAGALGGPDAYWKMVDGLFEKSAALGAAVYTSLAADLRLEAAAFAECQASGKFRAAIERDRADAASVGITGTPGFIVGRPGGSTVTGTRVVGAQPFPAFQQAIEAALAGGPAAR
jgi:protein-disulfide isomerase